MSDLQANLIVDLIGVHTCIGLSCTRLAVTPLILPCRSSNVRKQAVQLLNGLLQCNPYNAVLPVEELKESYKKELEKLSALKPQPNSEDAERHKAWPAIQKGIYWL